MGHKKDSHGVLPGSGNVFADLGLSNAEEKQTKLRLAFAINKIIAERHLSQTSAARCLEVSQPKVSALRNYELAGFSVERLMNFLTSLGRDVEILIRPKPKGRRSARILVTAA
jgi:predicted XRE-type DNA-binding protein